jgi:hypothetical protein
MDGHDYATMNSMTRPVWDRFFRQFLYYLAGYDTVAVTSSIPPRTIGNAYGASDAVDPSGITFHPDPDPGLLITKAGTHIVTLFDLSGRKIREERGAAFPRDYDFRAALKGGRGIYLVQAAVQGAVRTRKFVLR